MKKRQFTMLIEKDEDGFLVGTVPALQSCYTQARTMEQLLRRMKEAIELCLVGQKPVDMTFVGVQQIEVAR